MGDIGIYRDISGNVGVVEGLGFKVVEIRLWDSVLMQKH